MSGVRVLELLSLLQGRRHWSGEELARRLEVSPRTLRREIAELRALGYPVDATRGIGGGYRLAPGGSLPPLTVDDGEAVALVVGLRAATASDAAGVADAAVRALTKVVAVLPPRLRRIAEDLDRAVAGAGGGPGAGAARTVDLDVLTAVAAHCRDHETATFAYHDRTGTGSTRRVEPHALVPHGRRWYLVAFDRDARDWRTFRLDRMGEVEPEGRRFASRAVPGGDPARFVAERVAAAGRPHQVEVTVHAPAARVRAEVAGWGEVVELDEDRSLLVMAVDSFDWVAFALGSLDAPFTVHRPPELVDHLAQWAARLAPPTTHPDPG